MPNLPTFIAPSRFSDAVKSLAQVKLIYDQQIGHLRQAMQRCVGALLSG